MTRWAATAPGRLRVIGAILILFGLTSGLTSVLTLRQRSELVHEMRSGGTGPGASALDIYPALSAADANVASALLTGGPDQATARRRYEADIAHAATAITAASQDATDRSSLTALATLSSGLPVYTGLVETARTWDRQGLPLGVAYLREASGLMRSTLLPAAQQVYQAEIKRVADMQPDATVFPWTALVAGVLTLIGLLFAQAYLTRHSHRLLNVGLAAATIATLVSVLWVGYAATTISNRLYSARVDGLTQVQLLAQARIDASRARADEALALLARGSGQAFEDDYTATMVKLLGPTGDGGLLAQAHDQARDPAQRRIIEAAQIDARHWLAKHADVRKSENDGKYSEAVRKASDPSDPDGGAAVFNELEKELDNGIRGGGERFSRRTGQAVDVLAGSDFAVGALTALLIAGIAIGLQQRISEYR